MAKDKEDLKTAEDLEDMESMEGEDYSQVIQELKAAGVDHIDLPNGEFIVIYRDKNRRRLAVAFTPKGRTRAIAFAN